MSAKSERADYSKARNNEGSKAKAFFFLCGDQATDCNDSTSGLHTRRANLLSPNRHKICLLHLNFDLQALLDQKGGDS